MDWNDQDIEDAAQRFISARGDEAEERARDRARNLEMGGETELAAAWERIADAIVRAQSSESGGRYGECPPVEGPAGSADGGCGEGEASPIDRLNEKALAKAGR